MIWLTISQLSKQSLIGYLKDTLPEEYIRYAGRHKIDVIVETNKGLITKVQRIHRRDYNGIYDYWYWGRIYGSVIAWQPLPERYNEADE